MGGLSCDLPLSYPHTTRPPALAIPVWWSFAVGGSRREADDLFKFSGGPGEIFLIRIKSCFHPKRRARRRNWSRNRSALFPLLQNGGKGNRHGRHAVFARALLEINRAGFRWGRSPGPENHSPIHHLKRAVSYGPKFLREPPRADLGCCHVGQIIPDNRNNVKRPAGLLHDLACPTTPTCLPHSALNMFGHGGLPIRRCSCALADSRRILSR